MAAALGCCRPAGCVPAAGHATGCWLRLTPDPCTVACRKTTLEACSIRLDGEASSSSSSSEDSGSEEDSTATTGGASRDADARLPDGLVDHAWSLDLASVPCYNYAPGPDSNWTVDPTSGPWREWQPKLWCFSCLCLPRVPKARPTTLHPSRCCTPSRAPRRNPPPAWLLRVCRGRRQQRACPSRGQREGGRRNCCLAAPLRLRCKASVPVLTCFFLWPAGHGGPAVLGCRGRRAGARRGVWGRCGVAAHAVQQPGLGPALIP